MANENAKRAYEFMMKIKQKNFELHQKDEPELYAIYADILDELQTFASLEGCELHRSFENKVVYLIPNTESRLAMANADVLKMFKLGKVSELFLADFATLTLMLCFFNPHAVRFKIREMISFSEWEAEMTKRLEALYQFQVNYKEETGEAWSTSEDIVDACQKWMARELIQDEGKSLSIKETRVGYLKQTCFYGLRREGLVQYDPASSDKSDICATPKFEDLARHLLSKPVTQKFLDQVQMHFNQEKGNE